jgi:hypothetical protein
MTLNKNLADLRMDSTRLPSSASPVTTSVSQAFKNGKVIADDGNAFDTVQGAVDASNSIVKIPPETFNESVTVNTDGLTIIGSGENSIIDGGSNNGITVESAYVRLQNLHARKDNEDGNKHAINGDSSTDLVIKNCKASGGHRAIRSISVGTKIIGCKIRNAYSYAISAGDESIIVGNDVEGSPADTHGIQLPGSVSDCIVANNVVKGYNRNIRLSTGGADSADNVIYGNRCINGGSFGIEIGAGTDNLVINNRTDNTVADGGSGNIVRDNITG